MHPPTLYMVDIVTFMEKIRIHLEKTHYHSIAQNHGIYLHEHNQHQKNEI